MHRRQFLVRAGSIVLVLPATKWLAACGDEASARQPTSLRITSTTVQGHVHVVVLQFADIETPPAGGLSETTSVSGSHSHTVELTDAELGDIARGVTVTRTSSTDSAHAHDFQINRFVSDTGGGGGGGY